MYQCSDVGVGGRGIPPFHGYRETLREERPLLGASVLREKQGPHFCTFFRAKVRGLRRIGHSRAPVARSRRRSAIAVCFVASRPLHIFATTIWSIFLERFPRPFEKVKIWSHLMKLVQFSQKIGPFSRRLSSGILWAGV